MENNIENQKEQIKERIKDLDNLQETTLETLITDIHNIENEEIRNELYDLFIKRIKEYIENYSDSLTKEEIEEKINLIINKLSESINFKDEILRDNNFNLEEILKNKKSSITVEDVEDIEEVESFVEEEEKEIEEKEIEEKEIEKIEKRIEEIQTELNKSENEKEKIAEKYSELTLEELEKKLEELNNERRKFWDYSKSPLNIANIKDLEISKKNESLEYITKINDELKKLETEIENKKNIEKYKEFSNEELINIVNKHNKEKTINEKRISELNQELEKLDKEAIELWEEVVGKGNGEVASDELDPINSRIAEIKKELEELKNKKFTIIKQEKIERNQEKYEELMATVVKLKEYDQILNSRLKRALSQEEIESINKEIIENKKILDKSTKELYDIMNNTTKEVQMEINIEEIKTELNRRLVNKYKEMSTEELLKLKEKKENEFNDIYNFYAHQENGLEDNSKEKEITDSLNKDLKEIEYEINRRKEQKSVNSEELNQLIEIKEAYYKIMGDILTEFMKKSEEERTEENIKDSVNNHELIETLNKYENSEKLKKELIEDVLEKLNIKNKAPIEKEGSNKKLWLKALAGVGGFVAGLTISCVPGIGVIMMPISVLKLGNTAVNFFAKKNPEGKCAKIKNFKDEQINKITGKLENKFPGITEKINKMRAKLKSSPLNCFINGVAVGYITGSLIELFTGQNVLEHANDLKNKFKNIGTGGNGTGGNGTGGNGTGGNGTGGNGTGGNGTGGTIQTGNTTLPSGNYDLSSIDLGYVSSYSDQPVNLITKAGTNVTFDKVNFVNGEEWWHFLKPDGQGYAWFKADDVRHIVEAAAKTGGKTI